MSSLYLTELEDESLKYSNCVYISRMDMVGLFDLEEVNPNTSYQVLLNNEQIYPCKVDKNLQVGDVAASDVVLKSLNIEMNTDEDETVLSIKPWIQKNIVKAKFVELCIYFFSSQYCWTINCHHTELLSIVPHPQKSYASIRRSYNHWLWKV